VDRAMLGMYTDYLICSTSYTTATGLSDMTDNAISHDSVTRFLSERDFTNKDLWYEAKSFLRKIESEDGVLAIDDTVEEKPYTDENEIIAYHYDHKKNMNVKGINFVSALYESQGYTVPVGFQVVSKTEETIDKKTGKKSRRDPRGKQEYFRNLIWQSVQNGLNFAYVLADSWYSSAENMVYVVRTARKHFVMPLKNNRTVALSEKDAKNGRFVKINELDLEKGITVWLRDVPFPVRLVSLVFKDENNIVGTLYLVSSNLELTDEQVVQLYKRRWQVESYHKSLKCNASLAKSPTKKPRTQKNHLFASLCAYIKLESLTLLRKTKTDKPNHFSIKYAIYIRSLQTAWRELTKISTATARGAPA
jgi:hypothetical protein